METKLIDLNIASADDLLDAQIDGLEEKHVYDLIEYRDQHGPFESWEEVTDIAGFSQDLAARMQQSGIELGTEPSLDDKGADQFE